MVRNIQQITKAMKLVASVRLRRAQERILAARPYADEIQEVLQALFASMPQVSHPLLTPRETKAIGVLVISGDRGLCGTFNANIIQAATQFLADKREEQIKLILLGRRAYEYFRKQPYQIIANFLYPAASPSFYELKPIIFTVRNAYEKDIIDEVWLIYTVFVNVLRYVPTVKKLLPLERPEGAVKQVEFIYEPSIELILDSLLPKYVEMQIFRSILESLTSEQAARTMAMTNATDNAEDILEQLTLSLNKARQAVITKEIAEIATAAEALK